MNVDKLVKKAEAEHKRSKKSKGLCYMLALADIKPSLANFLRGSVYDPTNNDARIPNFIKFLKTHG